MGLHLTFLVTIIGFITCTVELIDFSFFTSINGLNLMEGSLGSLGFVEYALFLAGVVVYLFAKRKPFSILALVESCLGGAISLWLVVETIRVAFPSVLSKPLSPRTYVEMIDLHFAWNSIQLGINVLIIFYICYYELRNLRLHPTVHN